MNPKIKIVAKVSIVVFIIALTNFITIKFRDWYPPRTCIEVIFEDCKFTADGTMPWIRPIKDLTVYRIVGGDFTGRKFGEFITNEEVDEAIAKLEKGKQ